MAEKHLKKCSKSLVIREMQIKMTLSFHITPIRIAKIKTSGDNICWQGCGQRGTLFHCWGDCKLVQPLWKSIWRFLRKLEIIYLKTQQYHFWAYTQKMPHHATGACVPLCSLRPYFIPEAGNKQMSHNRSMDTENVVHLHNRILLSYEE